jgi:DNA-binding transcriptional MerR regulator
MADERKKLYYSISEVSEMTDLKTHILRFWESEFPMLRPRKNRAGNRAYTERDIRIVRAIRHLLYDEKYTIDGARARMKSDHELVDSQLALPLQPGKKKPDFADIRAGLEKLLKMVDSL